MKEVQRRLLSILREMGFSTFQIGVYKEVCAIPWGQTKSYQWIAKRLKKPKSSRAVGQALKNNPFPLVIPCHRVIRHNGALGGFSKGERLKKRLLGLEKVAIMTHHDDGR